MKPPVGLISLLFWNKIRYRCGYLSPSSFNIAGKYSEVAVSVVEISSIFFFANDTLADNSGGRTLSSIFNISSEAREICSIARSVFSSPNLRVSVIDGGFEMSGLFFETK